MDCITTLPFPEGNILIPLRSGESTRTSFLKPKRKVEELYIRRSASAITLSSKQMLNYSKVHWELFLKLIIQLFVLLSKYLFKKNQIHKLIVCIFEIK